MFVSTNIESRTDASQECGKSGAIPSHTCSVAVRQQEHPERTHSALRSRTSTVSDIADAIIIFREGEVVTSSLTKLVTSLGFFFLIFHFFVSLSFLLIFFSFLWVV